MTVMAMDQIDEYEQGENVRKWLGRNGSSLITGIALGLACVFAVQWWQARGLRHEHEAATQYFGLSEAIDGGDAGRAATFASVLSRDFAGSSYAALAAMRRPRSSNPRARPPKPSRRWRKRSQRPGTRAFRNCSACAWRGCN